MISVKIDGNKYDVMIENIHARPVIALVDGERFEVWPEADTAVKRSPVPAPEIAVPEPAKKAPIMAASDGNGGEKNVEAPLPGVIVAVLVKPGEAVSRGQELCTLEAMKMKNAIRSSKEGVIESVEINVGDQVNHGQVLMTFKE